MIAKEPVPAVRPASSGRTAPLPFEIEATRIARVDPRSGREIPLPAFASTAGDPAPDPDATILGAVPATDGPRRPVTAEVVPPRDARQSSEVTAAWAAETGSGPGPLLRRILGWPRRVVVLSAAAAMGLVLVAALLFAGRGAPAAWTQPTPSEPTAPPVATSAGEEPLVGEPMPAGLPPGVEPEALGAQAAGALADGRLEEARGLYGSLVAADPQSRAWSLAVEILD
ncbi:MAG TPA: hypothetical protein VM285_01260, partial [Polyangia bacterium]|nr:hypothetical protein [Polyangia bacterium]